ncbi:hypothetical protein ABK040_001110 [Willaertia magna]
MSQNKTSISSSLSPQTMQHVREFAEMTCYGIAMGVFIGATKGYFQLRKAFISNSTLDRFRNNLFYRKQKIEQFQQEQFNFNEKKDSFNPVKKETQGPQYDPKTTKVERKHIILGHMFHQAFRYGTNAGLFIATFSAVDLFLRSYQVFGVSDDDDRKEEDFLKQTTSFSNRLTRLALTPEQQEIVKENELIRQDLDKLHLIHKPIAGTITGGLFGLLATVPGAITGTVRFGSILSVGGLSAMYGLIFGGLASVLLIPLQSVFIVDRYSQLLSQFKKQEESKIIIMSKEQESALTSFVRDESDFLTQLEIISKDIEERSKSNNLNETNNHTIPSSSNNDNALPTLKEE